MTPSELAKQIRALSAAQSLPPLPLTTTDIAGAGHVTAFVHADLIVDLADILAKARSAGVATLDIYADTVTLPDGFDASIDQAPTRLSIVARRIVVAGAAGITLKHDGGETVQAARLQVMHIEGTLRVSSLTGGTRTDYDTATIETQHATPAFVVFGTSEQGITTRTAPVPVGLLALGRPLHQTLAAAFALAAGVLGGSDTDSSRLAFCRDVFGWITTWSGLQSDLAQIAGLAESVRALVPQPAGGQIVQPIPPRTASAYLDLAVSRKELAKTIELDAKFLDLTESVSTIASRFAAANIARDQTDLRLLDEQKDDVLTRRKAIGEAMERTAGALLDQQFDQEIAQIQLDLAIQQDKIDKIVSASFEIAVGVISFGGSIAAVCMGVPADPSASAKKDINGVQGLVDAFQKSTKRGQASAAAAFVKTLGRLYALPFTFLWDNLKDHKESIAALGKASVTIAGAAKTIWASMPSKGQADAIADQVGDAIRSIAQKPTALEARAAWDGLEAETVNQLDAIINDAATVGDVKRATATYKTSVQKIAIYGRLMADQQAQADAADRELATLVLQRCAQLDRQAKLEALANDITDRATLADHIRSEIALRVGEAGRSFFEASYGYRRAQIYETYLYPTHYTPSVAATSIMMETICNAMTTDHGDAVATYDAKHVGLHRRLRFDSPSIMASLSKGETVLIPIDLDRDEFDGYWRLRVSQVQARLETKDPFTASIGIELIGSGMYLDRAGTQEIHLAGSGIRLPFEYSPGLVEVEKTLTGVQPTPFATWAVRVYKPSAPPTVTALTIEITATTFQ
jgi:hypothetical protein